MHHIKRAAISTKPRWTNILKSRNGLCSSVGYKPAKCVSDVGLVDSSSKLLEKPAVCEEVVDTARRLQGAWKSSCLRQPFANSNHMTMDVYGANGNSVLIRGKWTRECVASIQSPFQVMGNQRASIKSTCFARPFSSTASKRRAENQSENKKDISTVEDPFDAPTYNIPEKPVTFAEGASYSFIILAGLGVAGLAGYAVFKELIFQPKEYKIFGKALERVQNDGQVKVRIGSPITGYGQESRNRAARQRIPNRVWTDENGVEHIMINFHIRGPRGAGMVYTEMYKDKADKQWKYTSLIVQIKSPTPTQLILESYIPA